MVGRPGGGGGGDREGGGWRREDREGEDSSERWELGGGVRNKNEGGLGGRRRRGMIKGRRVGRTKFGKKKEGEGERRNREKGQKKVIKEDVRERGIGWGGVILTPCAGGRGRKLE